LEAEQKLAVSLFNEDGGALSSQVGELQFSEVTVNQTTGTVLMRALFPNENETLLPGMFVRAKVHLPPVEMILVPQSAAVRGANGQLSVWVIGQDNLVHPQPIEVSESIDGQWLVESGVESGSTIVTQGFQRIRPGSAVKAVFEARAE
jgi:membrane fusion protein (multidrug efflux system)